MNNRTIFYIVILLVFVGGIFFWPESPDEDEYRSAPDIDSVSVPQQPSFNATDDTIPPAVKEDLAPGTALVRLKIDSIEYEQDLPVTIVGSVQEVLGYGSSTSPIATESEFRLGVSNYFKANPDKSKNLKKGEEVELLLSESVVMQSKKEEQNKERWQLTTFIQ